VIVESVLVFCKIPQVLAEIWRVLQPGGLAGINELTLRRPPPTSLQVLLGGTLHIHPCEAQQWRAYLEQAGFADIAAAVQPLRISEQLAPLND
jgi:ubiquinone/menaquinone biosynthesis C-methylase UbiE